ncbi:hypothetical protein CDD82_1257 [Ophiocordyceps australis]|uniref:Autophagy-related protein 16 domain-containing protein n=1 Tax=Ophiocordyceps australis TaxID=1399860 RepID=A0A2C5ZMU3_9HYPO|nr:hypothetical protein CDD82_1257 [Ophiocordyceps australis]
MADWREEYLSSLQESELQNPANMALVQACSQMAHRISALEAEKLHLQSSLPAHRPSSSSAKPPSGPSSTDSDVAQLRFHHAESLRSKGVAETRLRSAEEELAKLRVKAKDDSRAIRRLTADASSLKTRLKDREYEIREKRKLLEQFQDEMITLNLQLSMAEKERDKTKKENKDLVDRWMKRKAQEAEALNKANEK